MRAAAIRAALRRVPFAAPSLRIPRTLARAATAITPARAHVFAPALSAGLAASLTTTAAAAAAAPPASILSLHATAIDKSTVDLSTLKGKPVLILNVASR